MLGDDPDPSVMTERVGSGRSFGHVREGAPSWQERLGSQARGKQNLVVLGTVNEGMGNVATTSNYKFYENMRMQCDDERNTQINTHNDNEKIWKPSGASVSGRHTRSWLGQVLLNAGSWWSGW